MTKKPFSVTFLIAIVLIFTIMNLVRFYSAIDSWAQIKLFAPNPGPGYIAATGAFWFIAGCIVTLGLITHQYWAPITTANAVGLYMLYFWIDRLYIQQPDLRTNDVFMIGLSSIVLLTMLFAVNKSKKLFV